MKRGFLWLLHMISVFYIVKSETRVKNGRESNISRQPKLTQIQSPISHAEMITFTKAEPTGTVNALLHLLLRLIVVIVIFL